MSVGLGVLVLSFLVLNSDLLDIGDKLASVISGAVALATAAVALIARGRADPAGRLDQAAGELARRVRRQWTREAANRGLLHDDPLRVRWASSTRPVQSSAASIAGQGVTRLKLHGDVVGIASAFRQLPHRKLVVIGSPGAGKTSLAVLLVDGLLAEPLVGEPVPVLLDIAGWSPRDHLDTWLVRQLDELYPFLGKDLARDLVEDDRVLPVLDGLDEMPAASQTAAFAALRDAFGGRRPFVLTCRAQEYEALTTAAGVPLTRTAVVEIEPVGVEELVAYLPGRHINGENRWAGVAEELTVRPDGELARALDSPLMVFLARTAYDLPGSRPAELLGLVDRAAIERHLLAAYVPAAYGLRSPPAAGSQLCAYEQESAERWLRFLARDLRRRRSPGIAWWEIRQAATSWLQKVTLALVAVAAASAVPLVNGDSLDEGWVATAFVFAGGLALLRRGGREPIRLGFRPAVPFLVVAVLGIVGGLLVTVQAAPFGYLVFVLLFLPVSVIIAAIGLLRSPPANLDQATPRGSLRAERVAAAVVLSMIGIVPFVSFAYLDSLRSGLESGALWMLIAITAMIVTSAPGLAWAEFDITRLYLAFRGRLPLRLMAFADDAHRRGVLRQVGAVYQFRHARLQAYLAEE
ncbi:hypothetical protein [Paractinoplanes toevensis]|uniref:hypothetical protein n=1 Tax=Paractinoplanes toevensis TaxID=571911 RepID=UPI001BB35D3E|nr:hypothetical protein [Actinoplanes toevensis]